MVAMVAMAIHVAGDNMDINSDRLASTSKSDATMPATIKAGTIKAKARTNSISKRDRLHQQIPKKSKDVSMSRDVSRDGCQQQKGEQPQR